MSDRNPETVFPFEWGSWDQLDTLEFQFYDCVWLEDFGMFAKGERVAEVVVNYETGTVSGDYDAEGAPSRVQQFRAVPVKAPAP